MSKAAVAVLGATGTVGQKFITLLEGHPTFEVHELVASERSAGKTYVEACRWKQESPIPDRLASAVVKPTDAPLQSRVLFSGLDSSVAGPVEAEYAARGHTVISNSKNHRMDDTVPLVIPEINHDHLALVEKQDFAGAIVTNSNCSTMFLAMVLAPLHRAFGVELVQVATMQAVSGAGYPGVPSLDILGNVIPFIGGEEEKMESETQKILGSLKRDRVEPAAITISAQCNRVAVVDGHTEAVSIKFTRRASPEEVAEALRGFRGLPQEVGLPSAPDRPIVVLDGTDRPQPVRDLWLQKGMAAVVGRIRECPVLDIKMVVMGHNTVRGAAGAAILNAETMLHKGLIAS